MYRSLAYILSSLLASISGLILASRIGQEISAPNSLLLDSVAVALVGTSVLAMGKPNAWGTALGAFLMGVVITGLTILVSHTMDKMWLRGQCFSWLWFSPSRFLAKNLDLSLPCKGRSRGTYI